MEFSRFFTLLDREESIYHYFPFEVPKGVRGISLTMTHSGRASVVDLGLFDPAGFRGWSGSEREWVGLSREEATPGYLPGEFPAGTWLISIGLHRVEEAGITVRVSVEFGEPKFPAFPSAPILSNRPPARNLTAPQGWRWIPADFHSHSIHSDGTLSLEELASLGVKQGLELMAITDHNTVSHHSHLPAVASKFGINLLAGQEVTTASGHANAFGKIDWVDYREATDKWLSDCHERGGLLSINHPVDNPCHWEGDIPTGLEFVELWHSSWDRKDLEPLQWWESAGRPIPIGGSDFHRYGRDGLPGQPTTWILCQTPSFEIREQDIFSALQAGRVAMSASPASPVVLNIEDEVHVIDGQGCKLKTPLGAERKINSDNEVVRAEAGLYTLEDDKGVIHSIGYVHS